MRVYIFYASGVPRTDYPGHEGEMYIPSFKFQVNASYLRDAFSFALDKAISWMEERGNTLDRLCFVGCIFDDELIDSCNYEDKIIELQLNK